MGCPAQHALGLHELLTVISPACYASTCVGIAGPRVCCPQAAPSTCASLALASDPQCRSPNWQHCTKHLTLSMHVVGIRKHMPAFTCRHAAGPGSDLGRLMCRLCCGALSGGTPMLVLSAMLMPPAAAAPIAAVTLLELAAELLQSQSATRQLSLQCCCDLAGVGALGNACSC